MLFVMLISTSSSLGIFKRCARLEQPPKTIGTSLATRTRSIPREQEPTERPQSDSGKQPDVTRSYTAMAIESVCGKRLSSIKVEPLMVKNPTGSCTNIDSTTIY
uniref:Uncharacterized protein n=1 Tax=Brassica campestris TaxID=3711 RepID=A0A3P5YQY5_BRACM|nr:unnamed protein product [Brassica rapa]